MTFVIPGFDMVVVIYALCVALVLAFTLAVYELEQLAKPKRPKPPRKKK